MLHRVIIAAETVGSTGVSTLSIAQILGVSERNNRRDQVTSAVMFLNGWCLQGIEGRRPDVDRVVSRLSADRRLKNLRILVDKPIKARSFAEPMSFCNDPRGMLAAVHLADLAEVTANHAERMIELKQAA
ncbi:BLUF domain-containing protein [Brevundimonas staleyi]|uniref:BLUF domain-containing protein n=1 Tax=Brevundimonas staleyi TaxID=74326 RepID=A0ABW0FUA6_9CAUL